VVAIRSTIAANGLFNLIGDIGDGMRDLRQGMHRSKRSQALSMTKGFDIPTGANPETRVSAVGGLRFDAHILQLLQ
jgi:hypothetical protein